MMSRACGNLIIYRGGQWLSGGVPDLSSGGPSSRLTSGIVLLP